MDALASLTAYGNELLAACREQVKTLPLSPFGPANASGQLVQQMRVEVNETPTGYRLLLLAPSYVLTLIYGRRPGKFPPLLQIEQWIATKGIVPHPDAKGRPVSTKSLAFLIGRKIAREGSVIWRTGRPSPLFGSLLGPDIVAAELARLLLPVVREQTLNALRLAA